VMEARDWLETRIPIFLKISPDLSDMELSEMADVAQNAGVAAIIATNTTLDRGGLQSPMRDEAGGLSGAPLFERSTKVLARLSQITDGKLPLIGVGGISSAEQALEKIRVGASAVQLYSAMVYEGIGLVERIAWDLDKLLEENGFSNVSEAIGTGRNAWL